MFIDTPFLSLRSLSLSGLGWDGYYLGWAGFEVFSAFSWGDQMGSYFVFPFGMFLCFLFWGIYMGPSITTIRNCSRNTALCFWGLGFHVIFSILCFIFLVRLSGTTITYPEISRP